MALIVVMLDSSSTKIRPVPTVCIMLFPHLLGYVFIELKNTKNKLISPRVTYANVLTKMIENQCAIDQSMGYTHGKR